jgi:hypothetical protein
VSASIVRKKEEKTAPPRLADAIEELKNQAVTAATKADMAIPLKYSKIERHHV